MKTGKLAPRKKGRGKELQGEASQESAGPILMQYENAALKAAEAWFAEHLPRGASAPVPAAEPEDDPRLLMICMTPRSGSTVLSGALGACGLLGRGGERLNRNGAYLRDLARSGPRTLRELLDAVIRDTRTPNGVAQIKCDLPQLVPFLLDPASWRLLRRAHFVYLTREDLLGQAISRYRGFRTGVWHSDRLPGGVEAGSIEAPYDFAAIRAQIGTIAQMMSAYERIFALLGIRPLRITYEALTADPVAVIRHIAELMDVEVPAGLSLGDAGLSRVSGRNNEELRERFLAEAAAQLSLT